MEAGFGWFYPPGTPGPSRTTVDLVCVNPDCPTVQDGEPERSEGVLETDLGTSYLLGRAEDGCPVCGAPWEVE